jgi:hypothetical protein
MWEVYKEEGMSERAKQLSGRIDVILRASGMTPTEVHRAKITGLTQNDTIFKDISERFIRSSPDFETEKKRMELTE